MCFMIVLTRFDWFLGREILTRRWITIWSYANIDWTFCFFPSGWTRYNLFLNPFVMADLHRSNNLIWSDCGLHFKIIELILYSHKLSISLKQSNALDLNIYTRNLFFCLSNTDEDVVSGEFSIFLVYPLSETYYNCT